VRLLLEAERHGLKDGAKAIFARAAIVFSAGFQKNHKSHSLSECRQKVTIKARRKGKR
jgi:hypothetical protein